MFAAMEIKEDSGWCKTPLKDLQYAIRKDLLRKYDDRLSSKMLLPDSDPARKAKYEQVSRLTRTYLSTILYQYFFPFLSLSDEKRIHNSMHTFLTAIPDSYGVSFKNTPDIMANIKDALRETIESLRGVDVLYQVNVQSGSSTEDDRRPVGISTVEDGASVNSFVCLYTSSNSSHDHAPPTQE